MQATDSEQGKGAIAYSPLGMKTAKRGASLSHPETSFTQAGVLDRSGSSKHFPEIL